MVQPAVNDRSPEILGAHRGVSHWGKLRDVPLFLEGRGSVIHRAAERYHTACLWAHAVLLVRRFGSFSIQISARTALWTLHSVMLFES